MILASHGIIGSQITQFVGLLDAYPNAAAAYSLRKLRTAYTGSAIRVRRTNLDEMDIGFNSFGELDTTSLLAFTGTGILDNGFVKTWYDQSGNARNVTQATAANQPQIVSSGSVLTTNGKASLLFDGINDSLATTASFSATENTLIGISKQNALGVYLRLMCIGRFNSGRYLGSDNNTDDMLAIFNNADLTNGGGVALNQNVSIMYNILTNGFFRQNGAAISTKAASNSSYGSQQLFIGSDNVLTPGEFWNGIGQEFIFYPTEQSANVTGIETNINNFYSIY